MSAKKPKNETEKDEEETIDPNRLGAIWRGEESDEYAEAAITSTAAIALRLMGKAASPEEAILQAQDMWQNRDKNRH